MNSRLSTNDRRYPRMKALLVDDHGLFRHGLEMLLSEQSLFSHILHAATGQEALAMQAQHPDTDLVLLE